MLEKEFTVVFQYDEEQADGRRPEKQIKRFFESKGGKFVDTYESYGMIDVVFQFTGNIEEVQKIGNDILLAQQKSKVKVSQNISQKIYTFNVKDGYEHEELVSQLRELTHEIPFSKVMKNKYAENDLQVQIFNKGAFENCLDKMEAITKSLMPQTSFYTDEENETYLDNNNYTENKRKINI